MTSALPAFFSYFGTSMALLFAFLLVYVKITPYNEVALIREGNIAASISLAGALMGFALPIANVIAHSDTLEDLLAWGAVAGMIQLMLYLIARLAFPRLAEDIIHGRPAPAVFLAISSTVVGILNAACMTY